MMKGEKMSVHVYSEIYLHITWHTKNNASIIRSDIEAPLHRYLAARAVEMPGVQVHAVGGMEDHVHLAVRVPRSLLISEWIGQMKGASSYHINQRLRRSRLHWQEGYGVVSFGERALREVVNYIKNQREHHARGTIHAALERIEGDE